MEARKKREIASGREYEHLFPSASVDTTTIMQQAGVGDTVAFIPKVVQKTLYQTKGIAEQLRGKDLYATCRNIWHFVYKHIAYKKDEDGYEQIRSPSRSWHDRFEGVDCDCYSTFISSVLTNLRIPHLLRITKYNRKNYFQHIYPVVPLRNGASIIIDCVTDKYDYEVPYSEKKDYNMDLQYLNGIGSIAGTEDLNGLNDFDLNGDGVMELGRLAKKKKEKKAKKGNGNTSEDPNSPAGTGVKKKKGFKKFLNVVNKANPATLALRNGILASMKLNIGKIGSRLRWSYLSPNEAAKKNIDPDKFRKLVAVRQKLENIFYGAGGKVENMKKAILSGKGNKDKAVNGLGIAEFEGLDGIEYMDVHSPLSAVLGATMYHSENIEGIHGFGNTVGNLGEPATLATVAAASGVIATIAGMLKKIGDIFKGGKSKGSNDFSENANTQAEKEIAETKGDGNSSAAITKTSSDTEQSSGGGNYDAGNSSAGSPVAMTANIPSGGGGGGSSNDGGTPEKSAAPATPDNPGGGTESFWDKHKKWLLPVGIGVGGLTVIGIAVKMMKKPDAPIATKPTASLNGLPKHKNHHRKKSKHKQGKKKAVALL
ncbi:MAG: hypothetical protein JST82_11225 [Bacteroidetes bacterium]|nr:hypothetical protein [Bacteroidota bacterium]